MKVLIIGATGFVGLPAAQALVRNGHIVYGLARTPEKAKILASEEIIPVYGDASDPSKWTHLIASVDVVIEAIGGTMELAKLSVQVLNAIAKAAETLRPAHAPKVSYIYTSGTWVHGDNRKEIVTDTTPITNPTPLVAWRPDVEQQVVTHKILNGIVSRPGLVYGRAGSLLAPIFAAESKVTWPGTPGGRFNAVHTDDLATFFLLAAEKAQLIGGKIFDVTNDATESVDEVLAKAAELTAYEVALGVTSLVRPYLARALLGWVPRKASVVDGLEGYYAAWKAIAGK